MTLQRPAIMEHGADSIDIEPTYMDIPPFRPVIEVWRWTIKQPVPCDEQRHCCHYNITVFAKYSAVKKLSNLNKYRESDS